MLQGNLHLKQFNALSKHTYRAKHTRRMFDSTLVLSSKLINLSSPFYVPIIQIGWCK